MRYLITIFSILLLTASIDAQIVVKMKTEGGVSTIPCRVNGLALNFIFDTGASEVSMSLTEVSFMLKNGYLKKEDILGTTNYQDANGNVNEGITIMLREIEIAGLKLKDVKASVVKNLKAPLLLGQSALRKLGTIQMDFEENTITINPVKKQINGSVDSIKTIPDWAEPITDDSTAPLPTKDEYYYQQGLNKYWDKDYNGALADFNTAIAINPNNEDYFLQRALTRDMLNDYKQAIIDYNTCIKLNPKKSNAYAYRAETRCQLKDTLGALSDLQLAIQNDKANSYAYHLRGRIRLKKSKNAEAISDFTMAIKYEPNDETSYYNRGIAKYRLKNYIGAISDYDTAISLNENEPWYWVQRAEAKYDAKYFASANVDLNKAIELDPEIAYAYSLKGRIAFKDDELEDAIYYFEKAVELDPEDLFSSIQLTFAKNELKERVWISLGTSNDGDEWFMKTEMESKDYYAINIWLKQTQKKYIHKVKGKSITYLNAYALYLTSVDCKNKKMKFNYVAYYDSKGNQIFSEQLEFADWRIIPPGSIGESIVSQVCERYN